MSEESPTFTALAGRLDEIRSTVADQRLDGWLLYGVHGRNPVATAILGVGDLTRRYFVLIPAEGEPHAVLHGLEEHAWRGWPWSSRRYVTWQELAESLAERLRGLRVAMEVSPHDAVPPVDLVPAGVAELVNAAGAEIVSSGDLVTRFHSRWSARQLESHRRTARVLARVAHEAFDRLATRIRDGEEPTEGGLRRWVLDRLVAAGCGVGADCIVAGGSRAADPHYAPGERGAALRRGEVVLLDLWSKEAEEAVYADQTWMAVLDAGVPERVGTLWSAVRDARDAAVDFVRDRWRQGAELRGHEVDDVARGLIRERGWADAFIHRTGHSIDREVHGMGPNLDNRETRELRRLIPGIGFSVEPGIYLPGEVGLRSEINVYLGEDGPEVTTPDPQREIRALLPG